MKDFLRTAMVFATLLALFMGVRFMVFVPLHNQTLGAKEPARIAAAAGGCGALVANAPCFHHTELRS